MEFIRVIVGDVSMVMMECYDDDVGSKKNKRGGWKDGTTDIPIDTKLEGTGDRTTQQQDKRTTSTEGGGVGSPSLIDRVLGIYDDLICTRGSNMDASTYGFLVRVLLGSVDFFMRENKEVGKDVEAKGCRVVLSALVRGVNVVGIDDEGGGETATELWRLAGNFCRRWGHREAVVEAWKALNYGLTKEVRGEGRPDEEEGEVRIDKRRSDNMCP